MRTHRVFDDYYLSYKRVYTSILIVKEVYKQEDNVVVCIFNIVMLNNLIVFIFANCKVCLYMII